MRIAGWEALLYAHFAVQAPFVWGERDCCLWVADWVLTAIGDDFATDFRGRYDSEETALALIAELGYDSYASIADGFLPQIPVARASRGDIVLHPAGMLGICDGAFSYFLYEARTTRIQTLKCPRAWRVD